MVLFLKFWHWICQQVINNEHSYKYKTNLVADVSENGRNGIIQQWVDQRFGLPVVQSITLKYCRGKDATGLKDQILENRFLNGNPLT